MSISIRTAVKNVASEAYNKTNLFYYVLLIFISGICCIFLPSDKSISINKISIIAIIIYFLTCFLCSGLFTLSVNNSINNKEGIIPNLFADIKQILQKGFYTFAGCFIISFIMTLLITILFFLLIMIQPLLGLIIIPFVFILGLYFFGLYFNFINSLHFEDWFNIKKAHEFIKKSGGKLMGIYVSKYILINLAAIIIALIFIIPIAVIIGVQSVFSSISGETLQITASSISSLILSVIIGICNIYTIDLTAQYIKEVESIETGTEPESEPETEN